MRLIKPFNNRIDLDTEESLVSFTYRLSLANHYTSNNVVGDLLGIRGWELRLNNFSEKACEELSILSGNDYGEIYSKSYHAILKSLNQNQRKIWFLQNQIKYCPKCVAEKQIHKFLWGFRPVSICTKHSALLCHACQNCKRKVQICSIMNGKCGYCGYNLDLVNPELISEDDILYDAQYKFEKLLLGEVSEVFMGLSKFQIMTIFDAIFRLFDGFDSLLPNSKKYKIFTFAPDENYNAVAFANAYWMLFIDFPKNFFYALDIFHQSDTPRKKYRKKQLSNFLTVNREFPFINEAYEKYKEMQLVRGQVARNVETFDMNYAGKLKEVYFNKGDIQKAFDISRGEINILCERAILNPMKVKSDNNTNYFFGKVNTKKIIKQFLEEKNDLISKKEAASILNISVESVNHLIEEDLLKQKTGTVEKQFPFVSKSSVYTLLRKIGQKVAMIEGERIEDYITFEKCLDKYVTSGLRIYKLLQLILVNEIDVYSTTQEPTINQLLFNEYQLKCQLKKDSIETKGYTLADVSEILGFTERTLHKMIKAKLISPERITSSKNGRRIYYFNKSFIEQFIELYITSIDAAEKYKVKYSTLNNLSHKGVIKNYLRGVCQKNLFNKEELEETLLKRGLIKRNEI